MFFQLLHSKLTMNSLRLASLWRKASPRQIRTASYRSPLVPQTKYNRCSKRGFKSVPTDTE